ncbi:MAG TPA: porin family protein [Povalibacter sp.]|nr:porin family protein [Povalibacter sp.]
MRKDLAAAIVALGTGLFAMGASAAEYSGFYIGAGVGKTGIQISDEEVGLDFDADDTAFKAFAGYQFNRYFAVEMGYFDGGAPSDEIEGIDLSVDTSGLTASVVGMLPIGDVFSLYGKLGMASYDAKVTASFQGFSESEKASEDDTLYGVGAMFDIGERFQLRAEYEVINIDDGDFNMLSVNGVYKFGS